MYLIGQRMKKASVTKFVKRNMDVDWNLVVGDHDWETAPPAGATSSTSSGQSDMNQIFSYVNPKGGRDLYACGFRYVDATTEKDTAAVMFKMSLDDGSMEYLRTFGTQGKVQDTDPYAPPTHWQDPGVQTAKDSCVAIAYNEKDRELVLVLEVNHPALRPDFRSYPTKTKEQTDVMIVTVDSAGRLVEA